MTNADTATMRRHDRGFTLVELLVVMAIVAVVAAVSVPALATIRQRTIESTTRGALSEVRDDLVTYLGSTNNRPGAGGLVICLAPVDAYPWWFNDEFQNPAVHTSTCPAGTWQAQTADDSATIAIAARSLPTGVFIQGYVAPDGSFCLDAWNQATPATERIHIDGREDLTPEAENGSCASDSWRPYAIPLSTNQAPLLGVAALLPPAPQSLATSTVNATTITATWSKTVSSAAGASASGGYTVTLTGPRTQKSASVAQPVAGSSVSHSFTGTFPSGRYSLSVKGISSYGSGPESVIEFNVP